MSRVVYLNGEFVPSAEAVVSVFDTAFMHGAGLFETMLAKQGHIFRFECHMNRLTQSASKLLAPIERSALPSEKVMKSLLQRNDLEDARVRLTLSAGEVPLGHAQSGDRGTAASESSRAGPAMTVCVTATDLHPYAPKTYDEGVTVMIARRRVSDDDPLAGHKSTCYLPNLLDLRTAHAARCSEALLFNRRNELAEGTISNVFVVKQDRLRTPPLSTPVLPGVARSVVTELAAQMAMELDDRTPITIDDLLDADEVFLTNVIMQILPVVRVEKREIADGKPGRRTRELLDAYRGLVRRECEEPAEG